MVKTALLLAFPLPINIRLLDDLYLLGISQLIEYGTYVRDVSQARFAHMLMRRPILPLTTLSTVGDRFALRATLKLPDLRLKGVAGGVAARRAGVGRVLLDNALPLFPLQPHVVTILLKRRVLILGTLQQLRAIKVPVHVAPWGRVI